VKLMLLHRLTIWNSADDASSESDSARTASRCTAAILLAEMRSSTMCVKRGSHSLRRPADSLSQSRSQLRHIVTQRRFGDINCSDFAEQSRKNLD